MREEFKNSEAWFSRDYLPHYDVANKYQMLTYRLADSLPKQVLLTITHSAGTSPIYDKKVMHDGSASDPPAYENMTPQEKIKYSQIVEQYLDKGYGSCLLKDSRNAQIVLDTWKFFDSDRYDLIAYVVMPNHVHVLIKTYEGWPIAKVLHSWKSYTAKEILKNEHEEGSSTHAGGSPALPNKVWQREYWDRFIRNENHFLKAIEYIHQNPVKAGLCANAEEWLWSSVHRFNKLK
ncbi:REP-associated tyrosine transposase [Lentisphaera araneosa]|nr:transposase [Lentisphaera araneosa]